MKKTIIRKASFFLLMGALLVGVAPVQSQTNLYVYKTDAKLTVSLDALQKLTFTETGLTVNKTDGSTTSVEFSNLLCFSFLDDLYQYTGTGIGEVQTTAPIRVWSDKGSVTVKSDQTIIGIQVFDLQGRKVLQLHPQSQEINLSLANYPAGIYLLQIAGENGITTKKIINN
jgi:hypothetical protein